MTPHARYFMLHALVASEAASRSLSMAEAQQLVRRCEVVFGAISTLHADSHAGLRSAHGADKIWAHLAGSERLDVTAVSAPRAYAQATLGFWGPYLASESLLGLVEWRDGGCYPGRALDEHSVRSGLGDLLPLAAQDFLDRETLEKNSHLCLCRAAGSPDGAHLRELLVPRDVEPMSLADHRSQTIKLVLRMMQLAPVTSNVERQLVPFLLFDPAARDDPVINDLEVTAAWSGLALRSLSVAAWRDLWAWLVAQIGGLMDIRDLGDAFAADLPGGTVRQYLDSLPPRSAPSKGGASRLMLPSEMQVRERENAPDRLLATLILGALRSCELPPQEDAYFHSDAKQPERLSPTWLRHHVLDQIDRPLHDLAQFLTREMVLRSQRIALSKSSFRRESGQLRIPTRVFVRDNLVFKDSNEAGGGVSLRWDTLVSVLADLGLVERDEGTWAVTPRGEAVWGN